MVLRLIEFGDETALDRLRAISAFSFTEFAIVKATEQQGQFFSSLRPRWNVYSPSNCTIFSSRQFNETSHDHATTLSHPRRPKTSLFGPNPYRSYPRTSTATSSTTASESLVLEFRSPASSNKRQRSFVPTNDSSDRYIRRVFGDGSTCTTQGAITCGWCWSRKIYDGRSSKRYVSGRCSRSVCSSSLYCHDRYSL